MPAKNIGLVKDFDYVPLKGITVYGKEILVVKTGKNFLQSATRARIWDADFPVVNSKVKPSIASATDQHST
jgi:hypothetical protein